MSVRKRTRRGVVAACLAATTAFLPAVPAQASTPAATTRDPCLTGRWVMDPATSTRLLAQLVPIPGFLVTDGVITMTFRRGVQTYGSTLFVITGTIGDQTFVSESSWINEAPYRTRNGRIITGPGTSELSYGDQTGSGPDGTVTVAGPPGRTTSVPGGSTPYRCTRSTLTWPIPLGPGDVTRARFTRG
jgi:hypothetical protein